MNKIAKNQYNKNKIQFFAITETPLQKTSTGHCPVRHEISKSKNAILLF